jgi:hypothetical protein
MKDREVPNLQEIFSEGGFLIIYEVINYRLLVLGWRFAKTSVDIEPIDHFIVSNNTIIKIII